MRNLRFGSFVVFIILFIGSFLVMEHIPALHREPLAAAMKETGAQMESVSVNAWVKVQGEMTEDQLEDMVESAMSQMGIPRENYTLSRQRTKAQYIVRGEADSNDAHEVVAAEILHSDKDKQASAYVVINIEDKAHDPSAFIEIKQKVSKIIRNFGSAPRINTCLIGWLDGKLEDGEYQARLKNAFKAADASVVDTLNNGEFFSYTGFSPYIADFLSVGDNQINLNIAMRYSRYDDRTYILIGSPVITREY